MRVPSSAIAHEPTGRTELDLVEPVAALCAHVSETYQYQFFDVEPREDRTARGTSGEDDDGRPIVVPGQVGVDSSAVTLLLDALSFRAGQREWSRPESPPLKRFGISASSVAQAGKGRSVLDNLGAESSATFRYPDGGLCELEGC
jgi:hypothetical protein